eukprot:15117191-Alexandrium_andersonii.AAC.1
MAGPHTGARGAAAGAGPGRERSLAPEGSVFGDEGPPPFPRHQANLHRFFECWSEDRVLDRLAANQRACHLAAGGRLAAWSALGGAPQRGWFALQGGPLGD